MTLIEIVPGLGISERELTFSCDRSPGPGGQNVNKAHTRVTLIFDVNGSVSLSSQQKRRVCESLASRISRDGVLRIVSCKERTQLANRRAAVNRFIELLGLAFQETKPRKETSVPASAQRRRLNGKAHRSAVKQLRGEEIPQEE
jgi:ribosome-associated protein